MALERRGAENVHALARQLSKELPRRSTTAVSHKLREMISEREFNGDSIELEGELFPAKVVSGYIVITLPNGINQSAHHYIWRKHYGDIPSGYHVHHISGDRLDNRIINLQLMSASNHIELHYSSKPPETAMLFWFLQERGLWETYLSHREELLKRVEGTE
jgi:hypothetical protein